MLQCSLSLRHCSLVNKKSHEKSTYILLTCLRSNLFGSFLLNLQINELYGYFNKKLILKRVESRDEDFFLLCVDLYAALHFAILKCFTSSFSAIFLSK